MNTNKINFYSSNFEVARRIQNLNDEFRLLVKKEDIIFNILIEEYSAAEVADIFKILRFRNIFDYGRDPEHEHDNACFSYNGINYRWSIDYFSIANQPVDITNRKTCKRVLTVDFDRRCQSIQKS